MNNGEQHLLDMGFTKDVYDGFTFYENDKWDITILDNNSVKIYPREMTPEIFKAVCDILQERGAFNEDDE